MAKIVSRISAEDIEAFFAELSGTSRALPDLNGCEEDLARFFSELPDFSTDESSTLSPTPEDSNLATFFFDVKSQLDELRSHGGLVNFGSLQDLSWTRSERQAHLPGFGGQISVETYPATF